MCATKNGECSFNERQMSKYHNFYIRPPEEFSGKLSFILTDLVEKLRELHAVTSEGIFRISGASSDQDALATLLDRGRVHDWSKFTNVNTLAGVLKQYFRENIKVDPLFPFDSYDQLTELGDTNNEETAIERLKEIFDTYSNERKLAIAYLFYFLKEIADHQPQNKMTPKNLAIIFSPNIIARKNQTQEQFKMDAINGTSRKFVELLIRVIDKVFPDLVFGPDMFMTDEDIDFLPPCENHVSGISTCCNVL